MIAFLDLQELMQFSDLCQSHRCMQFGYPEVVADEWMLLGSAIASFVIMAMISKAIGFDVHFFVVCHHYSSFTTSNCFHEVEGKSSGLPYRTNIFSFEGSSDALARIFQQ